MVALMQLGRDVMFLSSILPSVDPVNHVERVNMEGCKITQNRKWDFKKIALL